MIRTIVSPRLLACVASFALAAACAKAESRTKAVGDEFHPFIVKNSETGDRYCQVCAYGGKPKIMAVGDIDDPAFEQDLVRIQKIVDAQGSKGVVAFALFGKIANGSFAALPADGAELAKLKELKTRLGLSFPVNLVPAELTEKEARGYRKFVDAYEVTKSRTVMFAGADNKVLYAETIPQSSDDAPFKRLEETIAKAL